MLSILQNISDKGTIDETPVPTVGPVGCASASFDGIVAAAYDVKLSAGGRHVGAISGSRTQRI